MVLAHQGGWDEAMFVLAPLLLIGALLLLANRRASAQGRGSLARRPDDGIDAVDDPDGAEGSR